MSKSPAFQFYPKQWLGDDKVLLMDWDARGMHVHFMCIAWQQTPACSLPDDDSILRRWVGNPANWEDLKKQIFQAWVLEDGRWFQRGLLEEFVKQQQFRDSRKHNAEARWGKESSPKNVHSISNASAMHVHSKCNALQSSSSSSVNKTPTPLDVVLDQDSASIHQTHPKARRDIGKDGVRKKLVTILNRKKLTGEEAIAYLHGIRDKHKRLCLGDQWQKDEGQFAKSLTNWLAPTEERYSPDSPLDGGDFALTEQKPYRIPMGAAKYENYDPAAIYRETMEKFIAKGRANA